MKAAKQRHRNEGEPSSHAQKCQWYKRKRQSLKSYTDQDPLISKKSDTVVSESEEAGLDQQRAQELVR